MHQAAMLQSVAATQCREEETAMERTGVVLMTKA